MNRIMNNFLPLQKIFIAMDTNNPDIINTNKKYVHNIEVRPEHKELMQAIGLKLITLREASKLTKVEICKHVGMSRTTYQNLEEGKVYWNVKILLQILDYYKISYVDFFKGL